MVDSGRQFSFPSDIVAGYQMRLLLYGAPDIFIPTARTRTVGFSLATEEAGWALEEACARLREMGWEIERADVEGREVVVASRPGVLVGLVASEADDGGVLTVLVSSEDEGAVREAEREVRAALSEALPGARELVLKSGGGGGGRG